jgi:hypothetical protein
MAQPPPEDPPTTLTQRLRQPRILGRVALAVITGFSSGVGQAVAKSVLTPARIEATKARLEKLLDGPQPDGEPTIEPGAEDQREALKAAPIDHLQAVASSRGIKYEQLDGGDLVDVILASQRSEHLGRRMGASIARDRTRQPSPPKRKADLQRQQRQLGKRKSR